MRASREQLRDASGLESSFSEAESSLKHKKSLVKWFAYPESSATSTDDESVVCVVDNRVVSNL